MSFLLYPMMYRSTIWRSHYYDRSNKCHKFAEVKLGLTSKEFQTANTNLYGWFFVTSAFDMFCFGNTGNDFC